MKNFKQIIAKQISKTIEINAKELEGYIETPKDSKNGDYAFPCFRLAKELRKAPPAIADEIKEKIEPRRNRKSRSSRRLLKLFYKQINISRRSIRRNIKDRAIWKINSGRRKNIVIDYSAPNIAKPFHIGHLRSTVIGGALYNIYKYLGYNVTGVNHLGDYGTQFGKLIEGYKMWGEEYDIEKDPINELTKIYIRINEACKNDEQILENCRNNFKN